MVSRVPAAADLEDEQPILGDACGELLAPPGGELSAWAAAAAAAEQLAEAGALTPSTLAALSEQRRRDRLRAARVPRGHTLFKRRDLAARLWGRLKKVADCREVRRDADHATSRGRAWKLTWPVRRGGIMGAARAID